MGNLGIGLTSPISTTRLYGDHRTASAGNLLRGITPARQSGAIAPEEDNSDAAAQGAKRRRGEILKGGMPTRREMLKIFKDARVSPKAPGDPRGPLFNPYPAIAIAPEPA